MRRTVAPAIRRANSSGGAKRITPDRTTAARTNVSPTITARRSRTAIATSGNSAICPAPR
jgi:hypothetical protein